MGRENTWEKSTVFPRVSCVVITPGIIRKGERDLLVDQINKLFQQFICLDEA